MIEYFFKENENRDGIIQNNNQKYLRIQSFTHFY